MFVLNHLSSCPRTFLQQWFQPLRCPTKVLIMSPKIHVFFVHCCEISYRPLIEVPFDATLCFFMPTKTRTQLVLPVIVRSGSCQRHAPIPCVFWPLGFRGCRQLIEEWLRAKLCFFMPAKTPTLFVLSVFCPHWKLPSAKP